MGMKGLSVSVACVSALLSACVLQPQGMAGIDNLTYHHDRQRTGWIDHEVTLTPQSVAGGSFGFLWQTPAFDAFEGVPARLFASPLYVDAVEISAGRYHDRRFPTLYVATTTGYVYAVSAFDLGDVTAGSILWRSQLTHKPCGGGTMGNLSTPIIDLKNRRLYVTSCDDEMQWQAHALDIRNGEEIAGWPVTMDHGALNAMGINRNGATRYGEKNEHTQRGALNLSSDGSRLYVAFGLDDASGWLVAVDTTLHKVVSAFSTTAVTSEIQGGMGASG